MDRREACACAKAGLDGVDVLRAAQFLAGARCTAGAELGRKATRNEFSVEPDGSVSQLEEMSTSLYGSIRSEWANPPTLDVEYPVAGRFAVHVEAASHAVLEIEMDDKTVLRDDSLNKPRDYFRTDFGIDVPAGRHRITLKNAVPTGSASVISC